MPNEKSTRTIVLSPGSNHIDDFNIRYVFYCEQVLKEIHRQQTQRKIVKDSTPIKIEDELRDCMMTILQRFSVRDIQQPVQCGYFCQLTNEIRDHDLVPILLDPRVDFKLDPESFKHHVHTVKIPEYQIEDLQNLLKGQFHTATYDIGSELSEHEIIRFEEWVALQGEMFINESTDKLKWHPFKQKEEITIDVITFTFTQTISTIAEFRNIGISTAEIVKMMWADLFEDAVNLQITIENK